MQSTRSVASSDGSHNGWLSMLSPSVMRVSATFWLLSSWKHFSLWQRDSEWFLIAMPLSEMNQWQGQVLDDAIQMLCGMPLSLVIFQLHLWFHLLAHVHCGRGGDRGMLGSSICGPPLYVGNLDWVRNSYLCLTQPWLMRALYVLVCVYVCAPYI